jgi:hypothetical protein
LRRTSAAHSFWDAGLINIFPEAQGKTAAEEITKQATAKIPQLKAKAFFTTHPGGGGTTMGMISWKRPMCLMEHPLPVSDKILVGRHAETN